MQGRLNVDAALKKYLLETQTVLAKSAYCKANPTGCKLKCNTKNICSYVEFAARSSSPAAPSKTTPAGKATPAAKTQQRPQAQSPRPQRQTLGGTRRLLRGGGW